MADNFPPFASPDRAPQRPWSREDWDAVLGPYAAVSDYPAALFPACLAAAYPECPIILSTRDFDSWAASMRDMLIHAYVNRDRTTESPMTPVASAYHAACWDYDFEKNGRTCFERHHAKVRALAKDGRKFLEYRPGDGWGPVCEFLGVDEVPDVPFPRSDDWVEYKKKVERERKQKASQTVGVNED